MKRMIKYIQIAYRAPRTKAESKLFALSIVDSGSSEIFINTQKNKSSKDLSDTFFHEMAHVFFAFHGKAGQMSDYKEEKLARKIGELCAEALK